MKAGTKSNAYRGFDKHIHITVSDAQRAKLLRQAAKSGAPVSAIVRRLIDNMEVAK